mmetsp:Transcript_6989/g.19810  ORF Transcript_6989/g.19810 Transcript_6989/m.19810 type:complete len:492 (-) Transcript_6989:94-1569(-)
MARILAGAATVTLAGLVIGRHARLTSASVVEKDSAGLAGQGAADRAAPCTTCEEVENHGLLQLVVDPRLLALRRAAAGGTVENADSGAKVSTADLTCKAKLLSDPECCLDQTPAIHVRSRNISRDHTAWTCDTSNDCNDTYVGTRGKDALWWPDGADCSSPRIVFVHGGGWTGASPFTSGYNVLASKLAKLSGAVVLAIDYPLVPVGNYSAILHAGLQALEWLSMHGPDGQDCPMSMHAPLFIGGDSSGGGSALSVLFEAQSRRELRKAVAGAFAWSPWTNLMCDTPTYWSNSFSMIPNMTSEALAARGDIIFTDPPTKGSRQYYEDAVRYLAGQKHLLKDPVASPYFASDDQLSRLPPLYLTVGGAELLKGDSGIIGERALQRGAPVVVDIFDGMWHDFPMYSEGCGGKTELWQGVVALHRTAEFIASAGIFWRKHGRRAQAMGAGIRTFYPNSDGSGPLVPPEPIRFNLGTTLNYTVQAAAPLHESGSP